MDYQKIVVDNPGPHLKRITLNRPEKRNPLSNELRTELFHRLLAVLVVAQHPVEFVAQLGDFLVRVRMSTL